MIRIVGLSATLPNYIDVARFLRVNPHQGLFFFDARFRPVPLGQTFIGIKARSIMGQLQDMDTVCYDKVLDNVDMGYQVCVCGCFHTFGDNVNLKLYHILGVSPPERFSH